MTQNPNIFGASPVGPAPPPGSPPPAAPATLSQEDRLLAAAGYLSYITGFWLVVPIVIYALKRDKSRFVAHHAMRALIFHILILPMTLLSWLLVVGLSVGIAAALHGGHREPGLGEGFVSMMWLLGMALPWLVFLVVCGVAALRAFDGRMVTTSLLGRLVERLIGPARTAAPSA